MPFNDFHGQDDTVVARLEIDVPDDADLQLEQISRATDEVQTSLEAAGRYASDYAENVKHASKAQDELNKIREKSVEAIKAEQEALDRIETVTSKRTDDAVEKNKKRIDDLEEQTRRIETLEKEITKPTGPSGARVAPLTQGVSEAPGGYGGYAGQGSVISSLEREMMNPGYTPEFRAQLRERADLESSVTSPEMLQSLAIDRGLVQTSLEGGEVRSTIGRTNKTAEEVFEDLKSRASVLDELSEPMAEERRVPLANQLTNVSDVLQSGAGLLDINSIAGGLSGAGSLAESVGGLGGFMGAASKAVPWLAAAGGGLAAYNIGANHYAGMTEMGQVQGGGYQEGMAANTRMMELTGMGLNPFINTQQARDIVMRSLNEGYSGDEFETVTEFVAKNMTDMNMEIGESFKLLRSNVETGGQSMESLNLQLEALKGISADTGQSLGTLTEGFAATSSRLIGMGTEGSAAGEIGMMQSSAFGDDPVLQNTGGQIVEQIMGSQFAMNKAFAQGTASTPEGAMRELTEQGPEGYDQFLTDLILEGWERSNHDIDRFRMYMASQGIQADVPEWEAILEQIERDGTLLSAGQEAVAEQDAELLEEGEVGFGTKAQKTSRSLGGILTDGATGAWRGTTENDEGEFSWGRVLTNVGPVGIVRAARGAHESLRDSQNVHDLGSGQTFSGVEYGALEQLADQYGIGGVDVILEDGTRLGLGEARKTEGLDLSTAKFVQAGGEESEALGFSEFRDTQQAVEAYQENQTNVTIDLTDEAKRLIRVDSVEGAQVSEHMQKSYSGAEGRRPNDAPVGEE